MLENIEHINTIFCLFTVHHSTFIPHIKQKISQLNEYFFNVSFKLCVHQFNKPKILISLLALLFISGFYFICLLLLLFLTFPFSKRWNLLNADFPFLFRFYVFFLCDVSSQLKSICILYSDSCLWRNYFEIVCQRFSASNILKFLNVEIGIH